MSNRLHQLNTMLEEDPDDSFLRYAVAKEYEKMGNLDEAINTYNTLKEKDPDYVGLYYHLGLLYQEMENFDMAMKIFEQGINIAKKLSDFHALSELNNVKTNLEMEL